MVSPRVVAHGVLSIAAWSRAALAWEAVPTAASVIEVREAGKLAGSFSPKTPADQRGPASVRQVAVTGHQVIEVRIPLRGEGPPREEVWLAEWPSRQVIWWDVAGAQDVDGETCRTIAVSERAIEEYQSAARLYRCDGAPAQLFRRVWDFSARRFRPQDAPLPGPAPITVQARRGDTRMPTGRPLGGFNFNVASASAQAKNAAELGAPVALNDGQPNTAWSVDGDARGAWLSARSSAGFPVIGLRLLPGNASSPAAYRGSGRPRKLTLILGPGADQTVDVELREDADGGVRRLQDPFWIALPHPVATNCVSVVVREAGRGPVTIADVDVITEVDGPQAVERLVSDMAQGVACETRRPLLRQAGGGALDKLTAAITAAKAGPARDCLVQGLSDLVTKPEGASRLAAPGVAQALAQVLADANPDEEKVALTILPWLAEPPIEALAALLMDEHRPDEVRARTARALMATGRADAAGRVLAAVGPGSPALRDRLRQLVASTPWPTDGTTATPGATRQIGQAVESAAVNAGHRRADLLFLLGPTALRERQGEAALPVLKTALASGSFEEKVRALSSVGMIAGSTDPAATEARALLAETGSKSPDGVLRTFAVTEWTHLPAEAFDWSAALRDTDPRVREMAAAALGRSKRPQAAAELIAGAQQEPWPRVRRAEIAALGELCTPEGNELALRAYERDQTEVRMAALESLTRCREPRAPSLLIRVLGRLPESADLRSFAARLLVELKDPRTIKPMAEALARLQTESQADLALEGTATETVLALARMGGPEAVKAAVKLLDDERPALKRAAVEALGMMCDAGAGAAALRAASGSKDESVSLPAAAAQKRCTEKAGK